MFKRFSPAEDLGGAVAMKSSAVRGVKKNITDLYPSLEPYIDDIIPKKDIVMDAKGKEKMSFVVVEGRPLFFRFRDGPYFPTLRLLHQYPEMMPKVRVDKGAIKFVFKGADIMCPGLTSAGGDMDASYPEGLPVAVFAEGKESALAVGVLKMSGADIKKVNKGIGIATIHHLDDQLWHNDRFD